MSNKKVQTTQSSAAKNSSLEERPYHPELQRHLNKDVRYIAIALRLVNALAVATFFQPDEYFQALEPAWQLAFGRGSGAWITWEWQHQLRSSLHPAMFAAVYFVAGNIMNAIDLFPQFQGIIFSALPRIVQGFVAAFGDFYTWKLAEKIYGEGSNTAWVALLMSLCSPWQWFCSTRTFSNSLETVLTIAALYHWPWAVVGDIAVAPKDATGGKTIPKQPSRIFASSASVNELRICLFLAGFACILRPTNLLVWLALVTVSVTRLGLSGSTRTTIGDLFVLTREAVLCGSIALGLSAVSDYLFFGFWTFPPYQWLNFNITQSLAIFYGQNRWDYYITEGLPLLLTTYLPFGLIALYNGTSPSSSTAPLVANARFALCFVIINTIGTLSLISHKEVRFIYPLLPLLHVLAAPHFYSFFSTLPLSTTLTPKTRQAEFRLSAKLKPLLYLLLALNLSIAAYTTQFHQRGVLSVIKFLRNEYETIHLTKRGQLEPQASSKGYDSYLATHDASEHAANETFAAFLMPCHSTPWRSHLVHSTLKAWALTCEPPLHLAAGSPERAAYRDEGDRFYDDPIGFLQREVGGKDKPWPRYVVGFEGIEDSLRTYYEAEVKGWGIRRRWEGWNSHWHDDSRRTGKVVVWEFVELNRKA